MPADESDLTQKPITNRNEPDETESHMVREPSQEPGRAMRSGESDDDSGDGEQVTRGI